MILAFLNVDRLGHSGTMLVATFGLFGCLVGQQMLMNWHKYSEVPHGPGIISYIIIIIII